MSTFDNAALPATISSSNIYQRVGDLTRSLHEALQELGYDKRIAASLGALPDAKDRLSFIARVTGNAAEKVLNTVDAAQIQQEALVARAVRIQSRIEDDPDGTVASGELNDFILEVRRNAQQTCAHLSDIMLAQDFHDLTGQTVLKLVGIAAALQDSLATLLTGDSDDPENEYERNFLDGPVAAPASRADVVSDQAQVDDLLESLGF